MPEGKEGSPAAMNRTAVERKSDRELVVTRTFNAPAQIVFEAWSKPELFKRWWVPKSAGLSLLSCDMDVRTGGTYRLVFRHPTSDQPMAFFGTYGEVTPHKRLVWTNDEAGDGGAVTARDAVAALDSATLGVSTILKNPPLKQMLTERFGH